MYIVHNNIIDNVPVLKFNSNYYSVVKLIDTLYPFYMSKGEIIMREGEIANQIYLIINGLIYCGINDSKNINNNNDSKNNNIITTLIDIIPSGTFFGKDSLNKENRLYSYNVVSDSFSELYFCYNNELIPLLEEYKYYETNLFSIEEIIITEIEEFKEAIEKEESLKINQCIIIL